MFKRFLFEFVHQFLPLYHSRCQNCPLPLSSSKSRLCSRQTRTMEYRTLCFINVPNVYDVMLSRSEVQLYVLENRKKK